MPWNFFNRTVLLGQIELGPTSSLTGVGTHQAVQVHDTIVVRVDGSAVVAIQHFGISFETDAVLTVLSVGLHVENSPWGPPPLAVDQTIESTE